MGTGRAVKPSTDARGELGIEAAVVIARGAATSRPKRWSLE
jgi:hypothetical protein